MNLTANIAACTVTLIVTLLLPILILILFARKRRGVVSAWFLGAAAMFIPQMLIRLPILNALNTQTWFLTFSQNHTLAYFLLLAFTAGLFELAGRYGAARLMARDLPFHRALAAGLGHGGIESMVLVGLTYVNNLVCLVMLQTGTFDALITQTRNAGADPSQLLAVQQLLTETHWPLFLLAGLERLLTMVSQAGMTVLVCYGVHTRRALPCCLLCLGLHTLLDASLSIQLLPISQTAVYCLLYGFLGVMAALSVYLIKILRSRWETPACPGKEAVQ